MSIASSAKRVVIVGFASAAMLAVSVGSASAHHIHIDPPGDGEPKEGWVGSPALPENASGEGLILGGEDGEFLQSPSHAKGLVNACEALRANGNGVVDIFGPPFGNCNHGGPPPGS